MYRVLVGYVTRYEDAIHRSLQNPVPCEELCEQEEK